MKSIFYLCFFYIHWLIITIYKLLTRLKSNIYSPNSKNAEKLILQKNMFQMPRKNTCVQSIKNFHRNFIKLEEGYN